MLAGQLVNGIVSGAMYALVAIGFSLVIGVLDKLNFAHPEVLMFGGFVGLLALTGVPFAWVFPAAFIAGGVLGVLTEFLAFRRFQTADAKTTAALASLAVGLVMTDLVHKVWGTEPVTMQVPPGWLAQGFSIGDVRFTNLQFLILGVALLLMAGLHLLLDKARIGRQIRAVAESSQSASLLGIDVKRVTQAVFFISSALAAEAGLLLALRSGAASSDIGLTFGLKALAIMAIGGLGDLRGALVGGLLIGVLEALMFQAGLGRLVEITVWVAMIAVLMFRPGGLFGGGLHAREQRA
ncbi:MAG TPA: branched-chain amino acid ABC transporter permease [Ramlibacter sp.]|jgi:branched-chain amino acid transport system permease protein|nr:branched-chain amino acid ABC transporter permease [Ramlibacter sp.]